MKNKIIKTIKGLNKFSLDDLIFITELDEEMVQTVLTELIAEKMVIKASENLYIKAENDKIAKCKQKMKNIKRIISFNKASMEFMQESQHKCTPSTFKSYKSVLNKHLLPFFRGFNMHRIKAENIDQFIEQKLDEGLTPKSIDNIVKLLGSILEKALKDRLITINPARAVKRLEKRAFI